MPLLNCYHSRHTSTIPTYPHQCIHYLLGKQGRGAVFERRKSQSNRNYYSKSPRVSRFAPTFLAKLTAALTPPTDESTPQEILLSSVIQLSKGTHLHSIRNILVPISWVGPIRTAYPCACAYTNTVVLTYPQLLTFTDQSTTISIHRARPSLIADHTNV